MICGSSLREFAKDSRILEALRNGQATPLQFFSLVKPLAELCWHFVS